MTCLGGRPISHFRPAAAIIAGITLLLGFSLPVAYAAGTARGGRTSTPASSSNTKVFYLPSLSVTSSTGKALLLSVSAAVTRESTHSKPSISIALAKGKGYYVAPSEMHIWSFSVPNSSFTNSSISLTSKQIGPYGSLALRFTTGKPAAEQCTSGSGVSYTVSASGNLTFNTTPNKNSGWGSVTAKLSTKSGMLIVENGCVPKTSSTPCVTGLEWSSPLQAVPGGGTEGFFGVATTTGSGSPANSVVSATRNINSTIKSTLVVRNDITTDLAPVPSISNETLSASGGSPGGSLISGGAKISLPTAHPVKYPVGACTRNGKTMHQYIATAFGPGSWTNGTPALTGRMSIGGNVTVPNATWTTFGGTFGQYSVGP